MLLKIFILIFIVLFPILVKGQKDVVFMNLKIDAAFEWKHIRITLKGMTKIAGRVNIPKGVCVENHGTILLNQGATLSIAGDIENTTQAKIIIKKNAMLLVESTGRIMATDLPNNYKWQGITVNSGAIKVNPNGIIAGMMNGIFLIGGGGLDIDGGKFYGNYTTFNIPNLAFGKIINSNINYFPPLNSGIKVGNLFTNSSDGCYYFDGGSGSETVCNHSGLHGIYLSALGNLINQNSNALGEPLLDIKGNTFERLVCGIRGNGYTEAIVDGNNIFKKCNFGILMEDHSKIKVDGNTFEVWNWNEDETNTAQMFHLTTENTFGRLPADVSLGDHAGIGIYTTGITQTITGNTFKGMRPTNFIGTVWGLQVGGGSNSLDIQKNTFENLRYGLWLREGAHSFANFRCNVFKHTLAASGGTDNLGTGLYVGALGSPSVAPTVSGTIGDNGTSSPIQRPDPSGNVWPVDPTISTTTYPVPNPNSLGVAIINGWKSPTNWNSIKNDNPNFTLIYWAFNNEFVTDASNNSFAEVKFRLSGNQIQIYPIGTTPPRTSGVDYVAQCSGSLPNVFPLRMAVAPAAQLPEVFTFLEGDGKAAKLGDAIPNPAEHSTMVPVFIPHVNTGNYKIELFDLGGKNIHYSIELFEKGKQQIQIPLSDFSAGVYGYRLIENGRPVGIRKLVILK